MDAAAPDVAAADQSTEAATAELPKSVVQRIVRAKAVQVLAATRASKGAADAKPANVQISKDALLAFSESGRVFINYLASTAHECAKEGKRVTISAADVFKALEELDFTEFVQPLQQYLEGGSCTGHWWLSGIEFKDTRALSHRPVPLSIQRQNICIYAIAIHVCSVRPCTCSAQGHPEGKARDKEEGRRIHSKEAQGVGRGGSQGSRQGPRATHESPSSGASTTSRASRRGHTEPGHRHG